MVVADWEVYLEIKLWNKINVKPFFWFCYYFFQEKKPLNKTIHTSSITWRAKFFILYVNGDLSQYLLFKCPNAAHSLR